MTDKLTPLILSTLTRAAALPSGQPPFASKKQPGLFPNTSLGKAAHKRCLEEGWLRPQADAVQITDAGRRHLLESQNPREVLEDLVRVVESRLASANELAAAARRSAEELTAVRGLVAACLPNIAAGRVPRDEGRNLAAEVLAALQDRIASTGEDCPLPDLYRRLPGPPTLGAFHDALRELHRRGRLHLHPWTGPLYALPEPEFALLAGHEVTFYASVRPATVATALKEPMIRGLP